jgi:hypothetical protein
MSKTAIVPVDFIRTAYCEGFDSGHWVGANAPNGYAHANDGWEREKDEIMSARPAVPDELIEEAAKAICCFISDGDPKFWTHYADYEEREQFRNMARAAARVFNGGKDE